MPGGFTLFVSSPFFIHIWHDICFNNSHIMKNLLLVLLAIVSIEVSAQEATDGKWLTNLEEAQKLARKEKKPVLLYFTGSDWCAPCISLKEDFFNTEQFKQQTQNMVLVLIDIPRRRDIVSPEQYQYNKEVQKIRNPEGSFPKLIAYNHKGRKIDEVSGYGSLRDPSYYFNLLDQVRSKY